MSLDLSPDVLRRWPKPRRAKMSMPPSSPGSVTPQMLRCVANVRGLPSLPWVLPGARDSVRASFRAASGSLRERVGEADRLTWMRAFLWEGVRLRLMETMVGDG
ncbi:uncharacterized protein PG986_014866 [Apiospora aurea]|uniref:Uncharacterized protein n=1 Tax=Apiospora aurea TaxID=335848 RepID=A0ABR1PU75_9PEZI